MKFNNTTIRDLTKNKPLTQMEDGKMKTIKLFDVLDVALMTPESRPQPDGRGGMTATAVPESLEDSILIARLLYRINRAREDATELELKAEESVFLQERLPRASIPMVAGQVALLLEGEQLGDDEPEIAQPPMAVDLDDNHPEEDAL